MKINSIPQQILRITERRKELSESTAKLAENYQAKKEPVDLDSFLMPEKTINPSFKIID